MTTTTQTTTLEQLAAMFNDNQIAAIKKIINSSFWGDCDLIFNDGNEYSADGYYTNLNLGREWSGTISGVAKSIKASGTNLIANRPDWWGDGKKSGDMIFFNMDLLNASELRDWAKQ